MNTRRDFLLQAAGLPFLLGGCSKAGAPLWLEGALRKMRQFDLPGLLFRLPADKEGRCGLGHQIAGLINSKDPEVHEVLSQAALLCLENPEAHFKGAKASDTLLLVDGDGYAIDGIPFHDWSLFPAAANALLNGPTGTRLAERAERAKRRASKEAIALLAKPELDVDGTLLPLLVKERLAAGPVRRSELRGAIEAWYEKAPKMPYGVETTAQMRGGCGNCGCEESPRGNLAVPCGMARLVPNTKHFVKFLK